MVAHSLTTEYEDLPDHKIFCDIFIILSKCEGGWVNIIIVMFVTNCLLYLSLDTSKVEKR